MLALERLTNGPLTIKATTCNESGSTTKLEIVAIWLADCMLRIGVPSILEA